MDNTNFELQKKNIPLNLARLLKQKKITKQYISQKLNVHWDTVNKWVKGERFPSLEKAIQLANLLGISFDELLKPPPSEPFPGYNEIIELPVRERYEAIWRLVGRKYGIEVLHALGDPIFKDKVPLLETQEEIVDTYNKVEEIVKHLYERIQKELKEKALETLKKE
jgi:transcriptional regulator with XRE-family HTH domain